MLVMPAPSGDGKSTLTGAFVAAGWDYLGDEAIGVRSGSGVAVGYPKRLAIDPSSRVALNLPESDSDDLDPADLRADVVRLHGEVGPVSRVVLPRFEHGAEVSMRRSTLSVTWPLRFQSTDWSTVMHFRQWSTCKPILPPSEPSSDDLTATTTGSGVIGVTEVPSWAESSNAVTSL